MAQTSTTVSTTSMRHVLTINGKPASQAELDRVMNAKPKPSDSKVRCNQSVPFSILR